VRLVITFTAMAERETLRADPQVLAGFSQALSGASKDLHSRLVELDGHVRDMLDGWRGGAGSAYGQVWDLWHRGAAEVQEGLSILAKAVGDVGVAYQGQDSSAAEAVRSVLND
jgi:WXG100 family type VII secretion target